MLKAPATTALIALNLVIFVLMFGEEPEFDWSPQFLLRWGGDRGTLTFGGEYWRLVTAMFVHAGLAHLAANMTALMAWGSVTERLTGTGRFLVTYFACGLAASLASAWLAPNAVSVGASGAIAGLLGVMVVIWWREDGRISVNDLLANIALNAFIGFMPSVDWRAHVGGFVAGLALGPFAFPARFAQPLANNPEPTFDLATVRRPSIPVSFREPMNFPQGTTIYQTRTRLVALLPDSTLVADDGGEGVLFDSAADYRGRMGDEEDWQVVSELK